MPNASQPGRRSIRLKGYDYAQQGAYFITVCTQRRASLFGEIIDNKMQPNEAGDMVVEEWDALSMRYRGAHLDAFALMPNHIHAVLFLAPEENVGAGLVPAPGSVTCNVGATTRVAPTNSDGDDGVRASLGATRGVAPTDSDGEGGVGAGLVPAPGSVTCNVGATTRVAPTLGDVIGAFKSITTVRYARGVETRGWPRFSQRLWQRNYYEHVVRDDESLQRIREYIAENPACWDLDGENPRAKRSGSKDEPWRNLLPFSRRERT